MCFPGIFASGVSAQRRAAGSGRGKTFAFVWVITALLLITCLTDPAAAATLPQGRSLERSLTGETVSASTGSQKTDKDQTSMYLSSTLTQRRGLCVLLENVSSTGAKHFGLIDTGNADCSQMKAFLQKHGVDKLEFLVVTHMHNDHIGNAAWLLNHYRVDKLYIKQFDANWSNGNQAGWEKIIRAAVSSPYTKQIIGASYSLSMSKTASPSATAGFVSFLKKHEKEKYRFKGLFTDGNTALNLGAASLRLYNWEIWDESGVRQWVPGKTRRCKVSKYGIDNSDNCFSLGVRLTFGSKKFWIGGDMNNLRLSKKFGSLCRGDEERIASLIGHVDAAVLNHHGRAGSNCTTILDTLSPKYVIYTSARADITSGTMPGALEVYNYIRNTLHLPDDQILWACDCWGYRTEDPSVTISSKAIVSAQKDGTNMETSRPTAKSSLVIPLLPDYTYTSYDVTGDGKADKVQIHSPLSGTTRKGLSIRINNEDAWHTDTVFSDAHPVTLVRLPGKKPFVLISILSPAGTGKTGQILGLYRYGKYTTAATSTEKTTTSGSKKTSGSSSASSPARSSGAAAGSSGKSAGNSKANSKTTAKTGQGSSSAGKSLARTVSKKYGLVSAFNVLRDMPVKGFSYSGAPAVSCTADGIKLVCKGADTLTNKAYVTFTLSSNKAQTALTNASVSFPYACGSSTAHSVDLPSIALQYKYLNTVKPASTLAAGTRVSVTHVAKNNEGEVRYRVVTADQKSFWIHLPKTSE